MNLNLSGKVVLVAGSDKAGAVIAQALAAEGALPAIPESNAPAEARVETGLPGTALIAADLSSAEGCEHAVQTVLSRFGRIDALVNVVRSAGPVSLEHGSTEKFVETLDQSLLPLYSITHFAAPHLKMAHGCIVNVAPCAPRRNRGELPELSCANGAILALTREWAVELVAAGVRVNAVIPQDQHPVILDRIAAMVVFLVSSRAAHITGQHLFVAGTNSNSASGIQPPR